MSMLLQFYLLAEVCPALFGIMNGLESLSIIIKVIWKNNLFKNLFYNRARSGRDRGGSGRWKRVLCWGCWEINAENFVKNVRGPISHFTVVVPLPIGSVKFATI